jgi:hypothetical protein
MKNYLIVESQNDKYFIEAMIRHLNLSNVEVSNATICNIDDYECMDGLNEQKIVQALRHLSDKSEKSPDDFNVGLLIDWDDKTLEERLSLLNNAIRQVFEETSPLTAINQFVTAQEGFNIACFFNGVNQKGELETLLKAIKSQDSTFADCLDKWRDCVGNENLSQKEFDKFWVAQYIRYDTCSKKEKKQVATKCTFQAAMGKPIWNFDDEKLDELKVFLKIFSE